MSRYMCRSPWKVHTCGDLGNIVMLLRGKLI